MGLDMYAFITKTAIAEVDFKSPEDAVEIAYWRKHPNLHGWMEDLYRAKSGAREFNCAPVQLDADDLDALEHALNKNALPETAGFFFGETHPDDIALDRDFIAAARAALAAGHAVFYTSWW